MYFTFEKYRGEYWCYTVVCFFECYTCLCSLCHRTNRAFLFTNIVLAVLFLPQFTVC